jgi:hypothetical protein
MGIQKLLESGQPEAESVGRVPKFWSVTALRRSSAARACIHAGISSEKSSSSRSGIKSASCASRRTSAFDVRLQAQNQTFSDFSALNSIGAKLVTLCEPSKSGCFLETRARAPPIALSGLDLDPHRSSSADLWHFTHLLVPPSSIASHASLHALASSRIHGM